MIFQSSKLLLSGSLGDEQAWILIKSSIREHPINIVACIQLF